MVPGVPIVPVESVRASAAAPYHQLSRREREKVSGNKSIPTASFVGTGPNPETGEQPSAYWIPYRWVEIIFLYLHCLIRERDRRQR